MNKIKYTAYKIQQNSNSRENFRALNAYIKKKSGFPDGSVVKTLACQCRETGVRSLFWEDLTCHGATKPVTTTQ